MQKTAPVLDLKYLSPVARADIEYKAMKKKAPIKEGKRFYKRGNASNISVTTSSSMSMSPGSVPNLGMSLLFSDDSNITHESLIDDFLSIVEMDGQHLPTLVHLGKLYLEAKDYALSEYWFERGLARGKARGASGGKSGISTFYGGATSLWWAYGWGLLAQVMESTDRVDKARNCVENSEKFACFTKSRGFECLSRMGMGEEW